MYSKKKYKPKERLFKEPKQQGSGFQEEILEKIIEGATKEVKKIKPKQVEQALVSSLSKTPNQMISQPEVIVSDKDIEKARLKLIKKMVGRGDCSTKVITNRKNKNKIMDFL
jgi:hypothetical protein